MVKSFDLTGKIILVTGGYGHLGTAITLSLSHHRATVYVLGRKEDVFNEKFSKQSNIFFQRTDISSTNSIKEAFNNISQKAGKIDILINNAFYSKGQSPEFMTDDEWEFGITGTLGSTFKCIREVIPYFKKQRYGKIINVSSMYGMVAPHFEIYDESPQFLNPPHYGAAKAGIIQLTKYYASFLGKFGICVNCITPGPFPSDQVQKDNAFLSRLSQKTLLKRIGTPEDLAGSFVFLSSEASDYITGQNIIVDGGWTSH